MLGDPPAYQMRRGGGARTRSWAHVSQSVFGIAAITTPFLARLTSTANMAFLERPRKDLTRKNRRWYNPSAFNVVRVSAVSTALKWFPQLHAQHAPRLQRSQRVWKRSHAYQFAFFMRGLREYPIDRTLSLRVAISRPERRQHTRLTYFTKPFAPMAGTPNKFFAVEDKKQNLRNPWARSMVTPVFVSGALPKFGAKTNA